MNIESFIEELKKININLTQEQLNKLNQYYLLLVDWNKKINLTRIIDKDEVYLKHFFDSLTLCKSIDLTQTYKLCDVGTGAGLPGIVLKIVFPNLDIVLVDSLNKRIRFLNIVIEELGLKNIQAVHTRMEDYSRKNNETFDIVVSRAVSNINVMSELCIPALKIGGHLLLMKANCEEEINSSYQKLKDLNSKICNLERFSLPIENSNRTIIDIIKLEKTASKYPRSIDKIRKDNK